MYVDLKVTVRTYRRGGPRGKEVMATIPGLPAMVPELTAPENPAAAGEVAHTAKAPQPQRGLWPQRTGQQQGQVITPVPRGCP